MLKTDVFKEKSKRGYNLDELVSTLQKSIRRGELERAIQVALELSTTSDELEEHVWHRLLVIASEDIGKGNWYAPVVIKSLFDSSRILDKNSGDRRIMMVNAIRFLCTQDKDRASCLYSDIAKREMDKPIDIPDYALDMHTTRGMDMKRGFSHFLDESAIVVPDCNKEEEEKLQEKLKSLLTEKEKECGIFK